MKAAADRPDLESVRRAVRAHTPAVGERGETLRAAVALVLRGERDPEVLFIRRAEREGDPWSGHIAFPGGRKDDVDADARQAAERETWEEVGLRLAPHHYVGRLDDIAGRGDSLRVSAFVYVIEGPVDLAPNHEVREAFWTPLAHLLDTERHVTYEHRFGEDVYPFPAVRVLAEDAPVLWGMTYRFVAHFLELLGHELPILPWPRD